MDVSRAKTISFSAKCDELFSIRLLAAGNQLIKEVEGGSIPPTLGGNGYVELEIDLATGQVVNWTPPTVEQLERIFGR